MEELLTTYREEDYPQCEALVNQAWGFDVIFYPKTLSNLAKRMYTKGSVLGSNYRMVFEIDGKLVGFIFGLCGSLKMPVKSKLFGFSFLWKLMWLTNVRSGMKKKLVNAMSVHEKNRAVLVDKGRSEIVLFIVSKEHQGKGIGTRLWAGFKERCREEGIDSIIVETNTSGASGFYENLGFCHLGDFDSPLHEFATKGGQPCIYEYVYSKLAQ